MCIMKLKRAQLLFPIRQLKLLKAAAKSLGISLCELMRRIVDEWLEHRKD